MRGLDPLSVLGCHNTIGLTPLLRARRRAAEQPDELAPIVIEVHAISHKAGIAPQDIELAAISQRVSQPSSDDQCQVKSLPAPAERAHRPFVRTWRALMPQVPRGGVALLGRQVGAALSAGDTVNRNLRSC
jgi:hypothetical protein